MRLLPLALAGLLSALWANPAAAQETPAPGLGFGNSVKHIHVEAQLTSSQAWFRPGEPLMVALRLRHDPHWHTYWINPGTGYVTTLAWELPPGWSAGEFQFPAPRKIFTRGELTGYGYEGEVWLPVTLQTPADVAPGTVVTLRAKAEWLMCENECIPGEAELSLQVRAAGPTERVRTADLNISSVVPRLPAVSPSWDLTARRLPEGLVSLEMRVRGHPTPEVADLWFFSEDQFIEYDAPQRVERLPDGAYRLTLKVSNYGPPGVQRLVGVLTAAQDLASNLGGLRVDVPLAPAEGAAPTPGPADGTGGSLAGPPPPPLLWSLLLAFVGGLVLNAMPCVFPVIGLKILGFVQQAGQDRGKVMLHGLVFAAGVLLSFWAMAAVVLALKAGGTEVGWGAQLQSAPVVFGLAALFLLLGLMLSGVFELGTSLTALGGTRREGVAGTFLNGVLAVVVATPCAAPFLGVAIGAAFAAPPFAAFLLFTGIGLGLSSPYLLLAAFPGWIKALPRPGAWMETVKQLLAFPLYATVAFLVFTLEGQVDPEPFQTALYALVGLAAAAWVLGRWFKPEFSAPARYAALAVAALLAVGSGWAGLGAANPPTANAAAPEVTWEKWSPEAVATALAEGRPVFVDFTARWCATCQVNKAVVFSSPEVLRHFAERRVAALKADWTRRDETIRAELAKFGRAAVPFNLVYLPGRAEPAVLPEVLTPGLVLNALRAAPPRTAAAR